MAKKTPEELAAIRAQRKAEEQERQREEEARQREQKIKFEKDLLSLSQMRQKLLEKRRRFELIKSDLEGCYDEIDKLTKKSPADLVTELQLEMVNDLIEQSKSMMEGDEFVDKVKKFVAAGDNPQYRDVLGVLRRLKQGLARFAEVLAGEERSIEHFAILSGISSDEDIMTMDLKRRKRKEEYVDPSIYDQII